MELQWPLILFTTFIAWSCGVFASQSVFAMKGELKKTQMPALIASVVIMVISGLAVFTHLANPLRIFNGFGNPTSGITHELIAIVVLAIVMVVFFAMLRREEGKVPAALCIIAIALSVITVIVCGKSYMMAARPAWDSILWFVALIGTACATGVGTVAFLAALKGEQAEQMGVLALAGAAVNAVASAAGLLAIVMASGSFVSYEYWYDLTHPMKEIATNLSPFSGSWAIVSILGVLIVGAIVPLVAAFMAKKDQKWQIWGAVMVAAAVIGAICLRAVFYGFGMSVFMFY